MSYLLKKLNEYEGRSTEDIKKMLYREGFASPKMDMYYEVKDFYLKRVAYYQRRRISNPKTQANYETQKAYSVSHQYVKTCAKMKFD